MKAFEVAHYAGLAPYVVHHTIYSSYAASPLYAVSPLGRLPCRLPGSSKALFRVNNAKLMLNRHKVLIIIVILIKIVFAKNIFFCKLNIKVEAKTFC